MALEVKLHFMKNLTLNNFNILGNFCQNWVVNEWLESWKDKIINFFVRCRRTSILKNNKNQ